MNFKNAIRKVVVVLKITINTNISKFLTKAQNMRDMLLNNPNFPGVQGLLGQLQADINTLSADESKALTRVKGAAATRNAQMLIVFNELDELRGMVQAVVNIPANANNAIAMVESSGMEIKGFTHKKKGAFSVKRGKASGSIDLIALAAGKRAAYEWQQSLDNVNWTGCDPYVTTEAKNTVENLTEGTRYYFRFRPVLPKRAQIDVSLKTAVKGEGDWSQSDSIIVT